MKACRECKYIYTEGHQCPSCESTEHTDKYGGLIIVLDPVNSKLAERMGAKTPGSYAVRV